MSWLIFISILKEENKSQMNINIQVAKANFNKNSSEWCSPIMIRIYGQNSKFVIAVEI